MRVKNCDKYQIIPVKNEITLRELTNQKSKLHTAKENRDRKKERNKDKNKERKRERKETRKKRIY